jgi:hypothetical protein
MLLSGAPIRLALWAYLRNILGLDDSAWKDVQNELAGTTEPLGRIESE